MKHKYTLTALLLVLCGGAMVHSSTMALAQDAKSGDTTAPQALPKPDVNVSNKVLKLTELPIVGNLFQTQDPNADGWFSTLITSPIAEDDNDNFFAGWLGGRSGPDVRVSPDVNNQNIRDSIKHVIGKADVTYEIDDDVPTDTKVSLKAGNITLTTAINAIIEQAGIGCKETAKRTVSDTNGKRTVTAQMHYHFTKKATQPLSRASGWPMIFNSTGLNGNSRLNDWNYKGNVRQFFAPDSTQKGQKADPNFKPDSGNIKDGNTSDPVVKPGPHDFSSLLQIDPKSPNYSASVLNSLKAYTSSTVNRPMIYNLSTSEERSTFTCPHCKQQITVIKKHVAPKCPTCGRVFQSDWKFCPADGTKRPEESGDWKFCPHCGKPVS